MEIHEIEKLCKKSHRDNTIRDRNCWQPQMGWFVYSVTVILQILTMSDVWL